MERDHATRQPLAATTHRKHLAAEVAAWQDRRNAAGGTVDWQFTTEDARVKLKRLYPAIQE